MEDGGGGDRDDEEAAGLDDKGRSRLTTGERSAMSMPIVGEIRKRGAFLIGHAPIRTQLAWCQKEGVPRAMFTHCGSEIIRLGDEAETAVAALADARGVQAAIAYDGLELEW